MPRKVPIPTGTRFGRLVLTKLLGSRMYHGHSRTFYEVVCDCGNKREVLGSKLTAGIILSCGCLYQYTYNIHLRTHGHTVGNSSSPTYNSWVGLRGTSKNEKDQWYVGQVIQISSRWPLFENSLPA